MFKAYPIPRLTQGLSCSGAIYHMIFICLLSATPVAFSGTASRAAAMALTRHSWKRIRPFPEIPEGP